VTVGVVAAVAFVLLVALLEHSVVFDDWVWWNVLLLRGCATDAMVDRVVDNATRALTVLMAIVTVTHAWTRGWRSAWPWVITCGLGVIASKTLKHVLTRERPSSLPDFAQGYSFPSAHAMNSVAALLAILALAYGFRRRNVWWTGAAILTVAVTVGRVVLARHWACDVLGGALAAFALMGLVVPLVRRRPVLAPVTGALVLVLLLSVDHRLGTTGLRFPTPLVAGAEALIDVDVGGGTNATLGGAWHADVSWRREDAYRWFDDRGTVAVDVSPDLEDEVAHGDTLRLAFGARTEKPRPACMHVGVELNGSAIGSFVPFDGWREYRVPIPAGLLRAGRNEVALSVAATNAPARFALSYLRIGGGSGAD
jgi:membrane-associated phospholipid phosphatase